MLELALFASVSVHAFHIKNVIYHHVFIALILLHISRIMFSTNRFVRFIDNLVTYFVFLNIGFDAHKAIKNKMSYLLFFPCSVLGLWVSYQLNPARHGILRVIQTLIGVIGAHLYLMKLHS